MDYGPSGMRVLYVLHSAKLNGTERMALASMAAFDEGVDVVILAPQGPVHEEARRRGYWTQVVTSKWDLLRVVRRHLREVEEVAYFATALTHSIVMALLNVFYRRRVAHLHMVHGGCDEQTSYGTKRHLNRSSATVVAVSDYVRDRLIANGVRPGKIRVVENFLDADRINAAPQRLPFESSDTCVREVVVVSRADPIKRLDLLFDMLDGCAALSSVNFRIFGLGPEVQKLRKRSERSHPNVTFEGFSDHIETVLAKSDLLLHLCPVEPFGLVILEAMAAGLPVMVPDTGGAASIVEDGVSGYRFRANDPADLCARLCSLQRHPGAEWNRVTAAAHERLRTRYSAASQAVHYRAIVDQILQPRT